jgi:putative addiction module killer protein
MFFIEKTKEFDKWLKKLNDIKAKSKILFRIQKLEKDEHFGDCKPVGDGISELRINFAKGYRVYFKEKDGKIIILLIWWGQIFTNQGHRKSKGNMEKT